ncbi:MAG: hypothetical protein SchgKO_25530 [Schleiferiaceae bacterium]
MGTSYFVNAILSRNIKVSAEGNNVVSTLETERSAKMFTQSILLMIGAGMVPGYKYGEEE